jgi:hypothetical protein
VPRIPKFGENKDWIMGGKRYKEDGEYVYDIQSSFASLQGHNFFLEPMCEIDSFFGATIDFPFSSNNRSLFFV